MYGKPSVPPAKFHGFHSASNPDVLCYLSISTHHLPPPLPLPRALIAGSSYLCICALHDLQSTPSHIPGHTGPPRGETAPCSGCTGGDLGTGHSGCHSLKDKRHINRNLSSSPRGLWPLCEGSVRYQAVTQSGLLSDTPHEERRSRGSGCDTSVTSEGTWD